MAELLAPRRAGELFCRVGVTSDAGEKNDAKGDDGGVVRWRLCCLGESNGDLSEETRGVDEAAEDTSSSTALMTQLACRRSYDVSG